MASQLARERAAQAWCKPTTSNRTLDYELAEAFAEILDEEIKKAWKAGHEEPASLETYLGT